MEEYLNLSFSFGMKTIIKYFFFAIEIQCNLRWFKLVPISYVADKKAAIIYIYCDWNAKWSKSKDGTTVKIEL